MDPCLLLQSDGSRHNLIPFTKYSLAEEKYPFSSLNILNSTSHQNYPQYPPLHWKYPFSHINPSTSHQNIFLFIDSSFSLFDWPQPFCSAFSLSEPEYLNFLNILIFRKEGSTKSNPPAPLSRKQSTALSNCHNEYVVIAFCFPWAPVPGGIPHCVCTTQDTWKTDKAPRFRDFNYFWLYLFWKQ